MFLPWPRSWLVTGISTSSWGYNDYFILRSTATCTPTCRCGLSSRQQTRRRCDTCGNSRTRFRMHAARYISYLKAQMPRCLRACRHVVGGGASRPAVRIVVPLSTLPIQPYICRVEVPTCICPIQIHTTSISSVWSDAILRSLFSSAPAAYPAVTFHSSCSETRDSHDPASATSSVRDQLMRGFRQQ
jgi:hypothetical protein